MHQNDVIIQIEVAHYDGQHKSTHVIHWMRKWKPAETHNEDNVRQDGGNVQ